MLWFWWMTMCVCLRICVCVCALCCSLHIVQYLLCSMTGNTQSDRERERDRKSCHLNVVVVTHSPNVFFFCFYTVWIRKSARIILWERESGGRKGKVEGPQWNWFYFRLALNLPAMWVTFWFFIFLLQLCGNTRWCWSFAWQQHNHTESGAKQMPKYVRTTTKTITAITTIKAANS